MKAIALPHSRLRVSDKVLAYGVGIGLALFPIHNPAIGLVLPYVGFALVLLCSAVLLDRRHWRVSFGPKSVWIPMAVIVASVVARAIAFPSMKGLAGVFFIQAMALTYLAARSVGRDVFKPLFPFVVVVAAATVAGSVLWPGEPTGGPIFAKNYDIVVGYLVLGFLFVGYDKWSWLGIALVLAALFLSGSPESVLPLIAVGVAMLLGRDMKKRVALAIGIVALLGASWFALGYGQRLYSWSWWTAQGVVAPSEAAEHPEFGGKWENALMGRIRVAKEALAETHLLGHGYVVTEFTTQTVHNVPLVVVQQLGPVAGVAWLAAGIAAAALSWRNRRLRYAWVGLFALSVFDHFVWTQMAPYWWALAGVSMNEVAQ